MPLAKLTQRVVGCLGVERPGDWSACGVGVVRKRLPARKTLLILCVAG